MDPTAVCRYATGIIAVGTGSESEYIKSDILLCSKIIEHLKSGNKKSATAKISSILEKLKIKHSESDLESIAGKILSLQI